MILTFVPAKRMLLICLSLVLSGVQAQIVSNGSFEVGTNPENFAGQNIGMTAPDSSTVEGWTVSSGTVDYIGSRWVAGDGVRSLDLSGISAGSIFQELNGFTPGLTYQLRFLLAANPEGGATTKSLQVELGSLARVFTFTRGSDSSTDLGWAEQQLEFTPSSPSLRLTFTSLEDNASGPALDQVRIAAVPEPSSWALLSFGVAAWAFRRGALKFRKALR